MVQYTTRTRKPLYKKLNPLWWFKNDDWPTSPFWRNPLHNLFFYVLGVADRNYKVYANVDNCTVRADLHQTGFVVSIIMTLLPRPFVSYSGNSWVAYAGWRPDGALGFKLAKNSP